MDRDDADEALVRAAREGGGDDELAVPLHALREELTAPAPAQARWNHLAAMRRAAADPTVELPIAATVGTESPQGRRHRAVVLVAAATVGVLALTGGLAAAGRLPRAAQDRVADIAEIVGVDLPNHDDSSREIDRPTTPTTAPSATGVAPAVGARGPGATGTPPGSSGSAPGHSPTGAGNSENAPGHTKDPTADPGTTPGSSGNAPGQTGGAPGNSGSAPGHTKDSTATTTTTAPGRSGRAPGQTGGAPGNSGSAPGHNKITTSDSTGAPGNSGSAPGRVEDTAGSSSVQGTDQ